MSWCSFYESIGQRYYCAKQESYVDFATYDKYCRSNSSSCPLFNDNNSSGCFLTTACIQSKNLPDDCDELQTLRNFRDNYLKKQAGGCKEIEHYYKIAPKIVEAINLLPEAESVYNSIYDTLITPCVLLIKNKQNHNAFLLYKHFVENLEAQFLTK